MRLQQGQARRRAHVKINQGPTGPTLGAAGGAVHEERAAGNDNENSGTM